MRRRSVLSLLALGTALGTSLAACAPAQPQVASPLPRYVVFYQEWSAQLDDAAKAVVQAAADAAKASPNATVTVVGFADPTGSAQANFDVSRLRAQLVFDQLVADGVPAARIRRGAHGPSSLGMAQQEGRRVEINIG